MEPEAPEKKENGLSNQVAAKERRKLEALQGNGESAWSGVGMFGMVGWSVVMPALLGTALGIWLDKHHPASFSWTITGLFTGLFTGCLIAWHWVAQEAENNHQNKKAKDE